MKKVAPEVEAFARIKVIGVGGSGKNATNHMIDSKVKGVEYIAVNTDAQDLHNSLAKRKIHIGKGLTRGLGTGMNPDLGKRAAEETADEIQEAIKGSDMVFIAGGLGGGTCSGASSVVAKISREAGALTVAVVTKPFFFEGAQRMQVAENALTELRSNVDALIIIPNDRLLSLVQKETSVANAFAICDDVLKDAVQGISDLITTEGIINVDFADIRSIMHDAGSALMGIGIGSGEKRAENAARDAINSPLLDVAITGAKGVLFSVAGGEDLTMFEVQEAAKTITESIDPNAKVIFGTVRDETLKKGEIKITVIASGFPENNNRQPFFAREKKEEKPAESTSSLIKKEEPSETPGKIYNSLSMPSKTPQASTPSTNDIKRPEPKAATPPPPKEEKKPEPKEDDDDDWSVVPAFLRRRKK